MARDIVEIALVEIASASQGSKELETVVGMTPNSTDPAAPVKTMTRKRRAIGYQSGVPDFSFDLEVVIPMGTPEVDWWHLQRTREKFLLMWEENEGGKRWSAIDCIVTDISKPFSERGETKATVKILALDVKPE